MIYSIGDVADLLGITTSAVRFLESKNIINPAKDETGRRLYNTEDIFRLLSYTKYKNMKIPLKEIGSQFNGKENSRESVEKRVQAARDLALEKAKYYLELANSIDQNLNDIKGIDSLIDKYEFNKSPEWLFLCDDTHGWISTLKEKRTQLNTWVEAMPHVNLSVLSSSNTHTAKIGYIIPQAKAEFANIYKSQKTQQLKSCFCLHTICVVAPTFYENPNSIFEKAVEHAQNRGFNVGENMVGNIIFVEVAASKLQVYVEVWVPIS